MTITHQGFDLSGFTLSKETLELIAKHDELYDRLLKYRAENADCHRVYPDLRNPHHSYVPALNRADEELRELEAKALAEGKTLPDRDKFMAKVRKRVAEYERMEPAMVRAVDHAEDLVSAAVVQELPELARQGFEQSQKAKKEYQEAVAKAETARASMRETVSRFLWAVTAGEMNRPKWSGWASLGEEVDTWRTTADGQLLTYDSARDLGLVDQWRGLRAELDGFVASPDETAA
ncbi:hypothetical protein GCM10010430_18790 [Kitasatospora cystarginea]|uniref:Uncharacterized protein n=1 Tax=Kitasatospora cystarginea TaxID=58350 RepID=A0ABP5QJX1_9ACTN